MYTTQKSAIVAFCFVRKYLEKIKCTSANEMGNPIRQILNDSAVKVWLSLAIISRLL